MPAVHTRRWLDVARHADGCQPQLVLRATGYWLVEKTVANIIMLYVRHSLVDVFDAVTHCELINRLLSYAVKVNLPRLVLNKATIDTRLRPRCTTHDNLYCVPREKEELVTVTPSIHNRFYQFFVQRETLY